MIGFSPQSRVFRRRTRKTRKQTKRGATPEMGEIPERGWNFDGATNRQAHARRLLVAVQEKVGNARLLSTRNHGWSHCWIGGGTTCLGMSIDHGMRNSWTVRVRLLRRQKITVLRAYLYRIPPSSRYSGSCTRSSSKPGAKKEIKKFDRIPDPGLFSLSLIWPMSPCQITLAPVRLRLLAIESRGKFSFFLFFFKGEGKCDLMCCESLHYDPGVRTSRYPRRRVVLSFWHCWSDVSGVLYTITQDDQNIDSGSDSNSFGIKAQIYDMQTATQTFILSRISLGPIQSSGNIGVSTKGEEGKRLMCP